MVSLQSRLPGGPGRNQFLPGPRCSGRRQERSQESGVVSESIMNQVQVEGLTVLLTGGAGGLARALSSLLLTRGAKVFLMDKEGSGLAQVRQTLTANNPQYQVCVCEGDVRVAEDWATAWRNCKEQLGEVDILVNIAGVKGEQDWEAVYDINLKGVHHGIETAIANMSKEKGGRGGRVLSISSTCGVTCQGDMYATPAYTASKHAVTALTRTFGHKFWVERTGVSVVAVAPYYIDTPFLADWADWTDDPKAQEVLRTSAEGKKFLSPDEAALKIFNVLNAASGSIWLLRPGMMPPFSVPDYVLPKPRIL